MEHYLQMLVLGQKTNFHQIDFKNKQATQNSNYTSCFVFEWKFWQNGPPWIDVSETFGAGQLWFTNVSVLIQRCSLPEILWNSAHSELNTTDLLRNKAESELSSPYFLLSSSEQLWFFTDSERQFLVNFSFCSKVNKYLNFEANNSDFQPYLREEVDKKNVVVHSSSGPII